MVAALALAASTACADEDTEGAPPGPPPAATAANAPPAAPAGLELRGVEGWINSQPLTIAGELARGRVVLVDFWTFTCVNCIRTLPFLEAWHERYAPHGLTVIGVHSPEFEFEESPANVQAAVARHGLRYAVVQDNDYDTWDAFDNRFWPSKYLIAPGGSGGKVVYSHFGEGAYAETEAAIRAALEGAGHDLAAVPLTDVPAPPLDAAGAHRQTAELYGGYRRNYGPLGGAAGQDEYYLAPDASNFYVDTGEREPNRWYLQGEWFNAPEAIVHNRHTTDFEDYIALRFQARTVNAVLRPEARAAFEAVVELDGRPLTPSEAGRDVRFEGGRSYIEVSEPRMYELVALDAFGEHELKLRANSNDFALYAFTFGSYEEGP